VLALDWPVLALGHPFGMTGARILTTLLSILTDDGRRTGLATCASVVARAWWWWSNACPEPSLRDAAKMPRAVAQQRLDRHQTVTSRSVV
jgi:hypothetical protein